MNELPAEAADVNGYIENVVRKAEDPAQLGGHFQSILLAGLRRNQHDQVINSDGKVLDFDEKDPKGNAEKLSRALMGEYARTVAPLIASDDMSKRARYDAQRIGAEVIMRFLPDVAKNLGIPIPMPPPQKKYGDYVRQLIGDVGVKGSTLIGPQGEEAAIFPRKKTEGPKVKGYSSLY